MAAIDPTAVPEHTGTVGGDTPARATLKVIYDPSGPGDEDSDDSDEEDEYLKALLEGGGSDDDEDDDETSSDDEEKNGGPSDPSKTKKARKEAAVQQMMQALAEQDSGDSEDEMDVDTSAVINGLVSKAKKGKGKATAEDSEEDESISEDDTEGSLDGMEELVVCTLDPEKVCNHTRRHLYTTLTQTSRITNRLSI